MTVSNAVAILYNPSSGKGRSLRRKKKLESLLKTEGISFDMYVSESEAHLGELAADVASRYPAVAAVGGDTTFNIVVRELIKRESPPVMGMIGTGSANDIVRGLGIHRIEDACRAIKNQTTGRMDVGRITYRREGKEDTLLFLGTMSAGLGTTVNRYVEDYYRRWGVLARINPLAQLKAGLMGIRHSFKSGQLPIQAEIQYRETNAVVQENIKKVHLEFSLLVLMNTPYYANGLKLGRDKGLFDGNLDAGIVQTRTFLETVKVGLTLQRRLRKGEQGIMRFTASSVKIIPPRPLDIQVDGDIIEGVDFLNVTLEPGALTVYCQPL
jgi:diacylglycerol kinase family enzyme